jgi:hypothetical protein
VTPWGRTSNIEHRTSNIEHRTSNAEHRTDWPAGPGLKHFPGAIEPLIDVGLGEAGAVPLLGVFEPGARGADVVVLRKNPPERRINDEGFDLRRAVYGKIELLEKDDEVLGIPGDEHFIEGGAVNVLAHAQKVGTFEASMQTIGLEIEGVAKARQGVFAVGEDKKKVPASFELLVNCALPIRTFHANGFQKFLGLITHGIVYAN